MDTPAYVSLLNFLVLQGRRLDSTIPQVENLYQYLAISGDYLKEELYGF